jgi:predicted metal-dependent phosphoesterase TrpH
LIDLHVHTDCSDGTTSPTDLIRQAATLGLEALGIADHDTLAGYDAACTEAETAGVELVCAVELSTRSEQQRPGIKREPSVHLLGYFLLSPPAPEFRSWLESHQASRRQRNVRLIENLRGLGVEMTLSDAEVYGRNQVGRPHFAKVLCEKGYVSTLQEAFDLYLADDARAAAERDEPSLEEGIKRICEAGGLASLAHPVRLPQQGRELSELVAKLIPSGLGGIEVYHSEHRPEDSSAYLDLARQFDLVPTGGSDYHGANKPGVQLGSGIDGNIYLPYSFLEQMKEMCYAKQ